MTERDREQFLHLAERLPIGIFELDSEFRCIFVNERLCELSGLTSESALGDGWGGALHADDVDSMVAEFSRALETGSDYRIEHRWVRADGSSTNCLSEGQLQRDENGVIIGFLSLVTELPQVPHAKGRPKAPLERSSDAALVNGRDISGRIRAEELLDEGLALYQHIVETAADGIVVVDADDVTVFTTRRMAMLLGCSIDDLLGTSFFDIFDDESLPTAQAMLQRCRNGGDEQEEVTLRHRDGRIIWARLSVSPRIGPEKTYRGSVILIADITEQHEVDAQLRYNEARLTSLFEATTDIMIVVDPDGAFYTSPSGTRILGYPTGHIPPGGLLSFVHPDDLERVTAARQEIFEGSLMFTERLRVRIRHADGHYRWFDCTAENQIDVPTVGGTVIVARDVTVQRAAEEAQTEAEARFRAAFVRSPVGMAVVSLGGTLLDVNTAFARMTGHTQPRLVDSNLISLVHPDDRTRIMRDLGSPSSSRDSGTQEPIRLIHASAKTVWVLADTELVPRADGSPDYAIAMIADITGRKLLEERLEHQAFHDPLTDLGNRAELRRLMDTAWERRGDPGSLALLFVDLDRFKDVNDTLGHDVGDEVLTIASRRLVGSVRGKDAVTRYGGDEFVVLCEGIGAPEEVIAVANRIRESLARTYHLTTGYVEIEASVGVAIDTGELTSDDLLRHADLASYKAKEAGRNRVHVFDDAADS